MSTWEEPPLKVYFHCLTKCIFKKNVSKEVEYILYCLMRSTVILFKTVSTFELPPSLGNSYYRKNNKRENLKDKNNLKTKINVSLGEKANGNAKQ